MSNYTDTTAIINVIGNVFKNPSILDDDRYKFIEEYFPNNFHRILFGSIVNLYRLGTKEITIQAIDDYLSQRPKQYALYQSNKGGEYLQIISENADAATFPYYYSRLQKMTLLNVYHTQLHMDLSWLYDPDNILDPKKKQEQEDWLDNSTLEEIVNTIDNQIEMIKLSYVDKYDGKSEQAGEGLEELLQSFIDTPDYGYPMFGKYMNTITRGARLKKVYMRSAATGLGKAIPDYTVIPTPSGYKKVGDIKEGDFLFGQNGFPTKVLAIHPQLEEKDIYEIHFSDGRIAECCEDHLWEYKYQGHRGWETRVESVKELLKRSKGCYSKSSGGYKYRVPLNDPVVFEEKQYTIHPYIMGLLLGDGSFRYTSNNKALTFSSKDEELPSAIATFLSCEYKKSSEYNYNYTFGEKGKNIWIEEVLKDYPKLWNIKSEDKFIPDDYLCGSIEQRLNLLAGLLDTDGSIDKKGRISFCTISPKLRDDVIELCHSLGFITNFCIDYRDQYSTGECYNINIQCKKEIKPTLFKLKRKHTIALEYANNNKRCEHKDYIAIIDIIKTDKKTKMTCFTVDNDNHLFLMNDYIVTHNTRTMMADACNFACSKIFNLNTRKWEYNGSKEPTLFISTEQEISELQTLALCFISGVNEEKILESKYTEDEYYRVKEACNVIRESPLYFQELPDFSLEDIENSIKRGIRDHGIKYICFDYIHSSMKILSEISSKAGVKGLREDNILFMIGVRLKDLANQYGVFIITATQLNGMYIDTKIYDQNLLRGAKSLGDKIDVGMIMLPVTSEDIEALQSVIIKNGMETPDMKISVYKNRRARYRDILIWCKTDRGTCRINPIFITDYSFQLMDIPDTQIEIDTTEKEEFK